MKKFIKFYLQTLLIFCLALSILPINAKAAHTNATAGFAETKTGVTNIYCPGTWYTYGIQDSESIDEMWNSHSRATGGCGEHHELREKGESFENTVFGRKRRRTWGTCRAYSDGKWRASSFSRVWKEYRKCSYCGDTSANEDGNVTRCGGANSGGVHTWKPTHTGGTFCLFCNIVLSAPAQGTHGKLLYNQTRNVSWQTYVDYTDPTTGNKTKSLSGMNNDLTVVQYGSNATIRIDQTTTYDKGNIVGYGLIINNGAEQFINGSTATSSNLAFSPQYTVTNVRDYTSVQFHLYTQAGNYYLPQCIIVPGSVFTYDPNNGQSNIYNDPNTTQGTGTMEKTIVLPNQSVVLQDCKFTRKGYYFVGWSLDPNVKVGTLTSATTRDTQTVDLKALSATKDYNAKNLLKGTIGESTNGTGAWRGGYTHTLYAIWAPISYDIDFVKGATDNDGTMPSQYYRYDESVKLWANTFVGRNYQITYDNNLPLTYKNVPTASIPHYELTNNSKDGTAPTVKSTLTFKDWLVASTENFGHHAQNTNLGQKNFEFKHQSKSVATAWWNDYSPELPVMTLPGYQWNGWYTNASGTTINTNQDEAESIPYSGGVANLEKSLQKLTIKQATKPFATTLYSKWTPNTYYVIYVDYDGNGNTKDINRLSSHNKVQTCTYDQLYHYEPDRPSNDEKIFLGWSTVDPDTYTWTKENIEDEPIWVQADGEFTNLTTTQHGVIYRWAVWVKIGEPVNPGSPENPPSDKVKLINTDQIQINGTNVYKDPTRDKTYYIQDNTLFDLNFNGITQIDKEYLRKYFMSTQNAFNDSYKNLSQLTKIDLPIEQKVDVTADATLTNAGSLINVEDFTARRTTDYVKLNYKQNYMLDADKDNMLINIYPTSQVTFINPFRKVVAFTGKSDITLDKTHNLQIICDSTPTTIMIPEEYDVDENGYVPIIEEDVTIPIKYADFVKNVDPSNPEYGSGVNTKNITVTLTQEQTDDGGAPFVQVFKDDTLSEIIKIKESSLYTGEIDLTFSPSKFTDISGFITIKIDITDNVGITVSKEYRFLVMRLETSLVNVVNASKYNGSNVFAPGENGQILIESNGFIDKASIAFPYTLDSLAAEEKSNAGSVESGYWHVGRTLSDTYPRDKDGNIVTVLPQMQTKLWGTTHLGGMQWNGSGFEHSYLTHFFYAPLYTPSNKYDIFVTIYKTDPLNSEKVYTITKTLSMYVGVQPGDSDVPEEIPPITMEFRDEIVDN